MITTCVQWLFQIVIAGITPHLLASIGWVTYLLYRGCCAASLFWVLFYAPDTKGVPLGRVMDDLFSQLGKRPQMECIEEVDDISFTPPATFSRKTRFYWIPSVKSSGWI